MAMADHPLLAHASPFCGYRGTRLGYRLDQPIRWRNSFAVCGLAVLWAIDRPLMRWLLPLVLLLTVVGGVVYFPVKCPSAQLQTIR